VYQFGAAFPKAANINGRLLRLVVNLGHPQGAHLNQSDVSYLSSREEMETAHNMDPSVICRPLHGTARLRAETARDGLEGVAIREDLRLGLLIELVYQREKVNLSQRRVRSKR